MASHILCKFSLLMTLVVALKAATCPNGNGAWVFMDYPVPNPAGTITFDDLALVEGAEGVAWRATDGTALEVFNAGGRTAKILGNAGYIVKGSTSTSNGNWDSSAPWYDGSGYPDFYWAIFDQPVEYYGELNFTLPVAMISARILGDNSALASTRMEAYDSQGNLVGCRGGFFDGSLRNKYFDYGLSTSTPIKRVRIYTKCLVDNIMFADVACKPDSCPENAWCFNDENNGVAFCTCKSGFSGDGFNSCQDDNECDASPCASNAFCTNLPGTFNCTCNPGYQGDPNEAGCNDYDECANGVCSPIATCVNYEGSFNCTCADGYEGDGITCTDKNECSSNPCDVNASCTNTEGSFSCECNDGYTGDGNSCTQVNGPGVTFTPDGKKVSSAVAVIPTMLSVVALMLCL